MGGSTAQCHKEPKLQKNQNPNVGKASPDHDIRPPFQENYVEASTSTEPIDGSHMNLLDSENEKEIFLTEEDRPYPDAKQFHTKLGESFDFK